MKKDWKTGKLSDVCAVIGGGTPKTNIVDYWDGNIIWVTPKDLGKLDEVEIIQSFKMISDLGLKKSSARLLPEGTVILSSRAPIGHLAIAGVPLATNQGCKSFICQEEKIYNKFLYYFLFLNKEFLNSLGEGSTFKEVSGAKLKEVEISLPPLSEQKRIMKILDEVFGEVAKAKENAEKNLKNSKALFESYLQSVFENSGDGWEQRKLNDVCIKITDGAHHSPKMTYSEKGTDKFPYITSKNIRNDGMDLSKVRFVDKDYHHSIYSTCKPELGDVLLTKDGANTGNVTLNSMSEPFSLLSSVALIKTNPSTLSPSYLRYYIQSPVGFKSIIGKMTGAAIKRIILKNIKNAEIPIPKSLFEQKAIVKKLDALSAETKKLEGIYAKKLADLEELKKSVLRKAFAGEL